MTIGIGILATNVSRLDHLVMFCDTQGSFGVSQSTNQLPKMFCSQNESVYAVSADLVDRAGEQFTAICSAFRLGSNTYSQRVQQLNEAVDYYKRIRFRLDVLPKYAHTINSLPDPFSENDLTPRLLKEWKHFYIGCELIVSFFDQAGCAALYYLDGKGNVSCFTMPGFLAIGSGADNSQFWLNYRNSHIGMNVRLAAYCAFEAKVMAENSPYVNDHLKMLVANQSEHVVMFDDGASQGSMAPPITLTELRRLFKKYGPKKLDRFV